MAVLSRNAPIAGRSSYIDWRLRDASCQDEAGIEAVMASLAQEGGGLLAIAEIFNQMHSEAIVSRALKYKIPTNVFSPQMVRSGGLIAYAIDFPDLFGRAADYVDRESSRAKRLLISLNVAILPSLLAIADEVIE